MNEQQFTVVQLQEENRELKNENSSLKRINQVLLEEKVELGGVMFRSSYMRLSKRDGCAVIHRRVCSHFNQHLKDGVNAEDQGPNGEQDPRDFFTPQTFSTSFIGVRLCHECQKPSRRHYRIKKVIRSVSVDQLDWKVPNAPA